MAPVYAQEAAEFSENSRDNMFGSTLEVIENYEEGILGISNVSIYQDFPSAVLLDDTDLEFIELSDRVIAPQRGHLRDT